MVKLFGEIRPQLRLAGGASVRLTVPVKPLPATVIVEVPELPAKIVEGVTAPALIIKSMKLNMIEAL